jgi:hypothetical protein
MLNFAVPKGSVSLFFKFGILYSKLATVCQIQHKFSYRRLSDAHTLQHTKSKELTETHE